MSEDWGFLSRLLSQEISCAVRGAILEAAEEQREAAARERRIDRLVELAGHALSGMCASDSEIPTDKLAMYADEIARATLSAIEAGEGKS